MKIDKLKDIFGCLLICIILLWPYLITVLLSVAFLVFVIIGAWKGWTK